MKNTIHLRFEGKVQEVGFRKTTQRFARKMGIGGWIKNLADGSVEMVAWGFQEDLDRLILRLEGIFLIEKKIPMDALTGLNPEDFIIKE